MVTIVMAVWGRFVFLLCAFSIYGSLPTVLCRRTGGNDTDPYLKLQVEFQKHAVNLTKEIIPQEIPDIKYSFNCSSSVSPTVPKSVHFLRPGDIRVVAALGDSLTVAYGAGATTYLPVLLEYPGLSSSAGGDKTFEEVLTLPNIFRKYNTHVYGYSTGVAVLFTDPPNKKLNVAISGSRARDMPEQARELVARMKKDSVVDFENDWKFVTVFVGGNDLCSGCLFSPAASTPEAYIAYMEKTVQILHDELPRTFVNIFSTPTIDQMADLTGPLTCDFDISILCVCVLGGYIPRRLAYYKSREYQQLLRELIESGKFDDKDDFAAVYQPFTEETKFPTLPDGKIDRSYFSPDCFHLSQKGQAAQATANWNNLFEPVGSKDTSYDPGEVINCPSENFPYLYTNVNSRPEFLQKLKNSPQD